MLEVIITVVTFFILSFIAEVVIHYVMAAYRLYRDRDTTVIINGDYVRIYTEQPQIK